MQITYKYSRLACRPELESYVRGQIEVFLPQQDFQDPKVNVSFAVGPNGFHARIRVKLDVDVILRREGFGHSIEHAVDSSIEKIRADIPYSERSRRLGS